MAFPIEISQLMLENTRDSHNKFYELTIVTNDTGKAVLLKRYGKRSAFGDLKVQVFKTQGLADKELEKVFKEKTGPRKGYEVTKPEKSKTAQNEGEARLALGPAVWPKLPPEFFTHLELPVDTTGRKPLAEPRFEEDGTFNGDKQRTLSRQEIEARAAAEREEEARKAVAEYEANEEFGAW